MVPKTLAQDEEGTAPLCLQLLPSARLSLSFFAILGPSIPPALGSPHPYPLFVSVSSPLSHLVFCLFFSLWSPLGLCSQEGRDMGPPIFPGVPSLTRVPLQSVSPGGMFCEVSLLQGLSIPLWHTTLASLGKQLPLWVKLDMSACVREGMGSRELEGAPKSYPCLDHSDFRPTAPYPGLQTKLAENRAKPVGPHIRAEAQSPARSQCHLQGRHNQGSGAHRSRR